MYICHKNQSLKLNCPINLFEIGKLKINALLMNEKKNDFNNIKKYDDFKKRIENLKNTTVNWLNEKKKEGKLVINYGASDKRKCITSIL